MIEEYEEQNRKRTTRMRSIMDYSRGALLLIAGILLLSFKISKLEDLNRQLLGGLFILYGAWRIYRGYKKNYFR